MNAYAKIIYFALIALVIVQANATPLRIQRDVWHKNLTNELNRKLDAVVNVMENFQNNKAMSSTDLKQYQQDNQQNYDTVTIVADQTQRNRRAATTKRRRLIKIQPPNKYEKSVANHMQINKSWG